MKYSPGVILLAVVGGTVLLLLAVAFAYLGMFAPWTFDPPNNPGHP